MTPADIERISLMAWKAGITCSGDMTAALERFRQLAIEDFCIRSGKYLTNDAAREAVIADAVAEEQARLSADVERAHEARREAQRENADLKERAARAGIELRRAVAEEREECAKLCDEVKAKSRQHLFRSAAAICGGSIRDRGTAPDQRPNPSTDWARPREIIKDHQTDDLINGGGA